MDVWFFNLLPSYFVKMSIEIWTHNCGAGGMRNISMRAPAGRGGGLSRHTAKLSTYGAGRRMESAFIKK